MTDPTSGPAGPSDVPGLVSAPGSGPVSERMRALLSKAVDEQLSEQRAVSSVLQDLRSQVSALSEAVSRTASGAGVERVAADLAALTGDLRTSTATLGGRIEGLGRRVDEQASVLSASGQGGEATALKLAALAEEVEGTSRALAQLDATLGRLPGVEALGAVQQDVAGLADRLAPLVDVRSALDDLALRSDAETLRPELQALQSRVEALPGAAELAKNRDSVVEALGARLERLEALAGRPAVGPEALDAAVLRLTGQLDTLATAGPVLDRLDPLEQRLSALEGRLGEVLSALGDVGDVAGGVPALSTDLAEVSTRVRELPALRTDLAGLRQAVDALRDDSATPALVLGLAAVREDVGELISRVADSVPPTADAVAAAVSPKVADRLVDGLAPRVGDVVMSRVGPALVLQVSAAVGQRVMAEVTDVVRTLTLDSERRVLAHVDEAVLALADALLRRRRTGRPVGEVVAPVVVEQTAPPLPVAPPEAATDAAFDVATVAPGLGDVVSLPEAAPEDALPDALLPDVLLPDALLPDVLLPDAAAEEALPEVEPEAAADVEPDVEPDVELETAAVAEPDVETETETAAAVEPDVEADVEPEAVLEDSLTVAPDVEPDAQPTAEPDVEQPAAELTAPSVAVADPAPRPAVTARERLAAATRQVSREQASGDFQLPEVEPADVGPYDSTQTYGAPDRASVETGADETGADETGADDSAAGRPARSPLSTSSAPPFSREAAEHREGLPTGSPEGYEDDDDEARRRRPWWRPGG